MADALTGEVTELLQQLIRNECVNDGRAESGEEWRSADTVRSYLQVPGLELEVYEPTPGRVSVATRIEGTDADAPSLLLLGHTDVVPVTPSHWSRDPFGGELVDGEVWGRGAIDMLNLTASMAVAVRHLAVSGFRPRGTLVYCAVADEEAGGRHGAEWLAEHAADDLGCDYVITESGGMVHDGPKGRTVTVTVAEKGASWRRLRVSGAPGHGSMPYGVDNALVKAAEVVRRLADYRPAAHLGDLWTGFVENHGFPDDVVEALLDPGRVLAALDTLDPRLAKLGHACTHTTFSPNVVHGGVKTNVIPDEVVLEVDIRTIPGETDTDVERHLANALGDLAGAVSIEAIHPPWPSSRSTTDSPLYDAIGRAVKDVYPDATLLPRLIVGGTDARFFRAQGAVAYGFGLFSPEVTFEDLSTRFHGIDERVDVESLRLTTEAWIRLCEDFLG
jgi:acetylornithine deacetylase/succinyl-diaminopimelate desuccinylase-like protein